MTSERWLPISGYRGGCLISDHGRVRRGERILKQATDKYGYKRIALRTVDGKGALPTVHRLVALHFVGIPNERLECAHLDGDKTNNHWRNLSFVTTAENSRHRIIHGTQAAGESHGSSKLTEQDVAEIRASIQRGSREFGGRALAIRYGVNEATIRRAANGTNWFRRARAALGKGGE